MVRRQRAALLPNNLPQLQNLIKRDPLSYKEEFLQQWKHFESSLVLLRLKPEDEGKNVGELVMFLAQVCSCYRAECSTFPDQIIDILQTHYSILHFELRRTLVQCLILLRNKGFIPSSKTLSLFFTLFRCHDKVLREQLYTHIVSDIRTANMKSKNNRLNKDMQNFMYNMIANIENTSAMGSGGDNAIAAKRSLDVCIELYRKQIWNDAKTANIIAGACFSPNAKLVATAVKFFLGTDGEEETADDDQGAEAPDLRKFQHNAHVNKKTKAKSRQYEKALATLRKNQNKGQKAESFNFSAIHLIHDPQGFADKLYTRLNRGSGAKHSTIERFEVRLMIMKLIGRLIGTHQLHVLAFYPFLLKYVQPHQVNVTQVLALLAQACHPLVPPEAIEPVLMTIANRFVTDNCSPEVMAAGINSIRMVCARCPLAMGQDLLHDLVQFKIHRDKGVSMAARSLITLFREVNPELLQRRDRGKNATMKISAHQQHVPQFGEVHVHQNVDGTDMLSGKKGAGSTPGEDDDNSSAWEFASDDDDSDGGEWITMPQSDTEEAVISDDENNGELGSSDQVEVEEGESDASDDEGEDGDEDDDESEDDEDEEDEAEAEVEIDELAPAKRVELTKFLTPQDFARINEMKLQNKARETLDNPAPAGKSEPIDFERVVDEGEVIGEYRKRRKANYEDRMASIKAGREDRPKFGSKKGRQNENASSTNKQKSRKKAFTMVVHKRSVVQKGRMSLRDKQKQLRAHIERQKRKGH
ncbi:SDA1-domain-containing protein [Dimargaris cristalligena]|uniref:Protein SDA1 n=1 Tax=Dimargaris cristalligena TaxID=215637 RepID=A0A4P9ZSJ1_9FUNG|nr:SDA1-domain-containing protein [Dimargaris cristalligena]|eukprot:RKP35672.1 SDA1-domain-containing protein [Dimargaris cristalligena]